MDVKEIKDLIDIREYIVKIVESPSVQKKDAYAAVNLVPLLDKKILEYILSDDFKSSLGIGDKPLETVKSALKK